MQAPWIMMLEGDYVWMKPLPAPRADSEDPSWAFPFSYINPYAAHLQPIMRLMYPEANGPLSGIPNSGPAPVLMRVHEWRKVCFQLQILHCFCPGLAQYPRHDFLVSLMTTEGHCKVQPVSSGLANNLLVPLGKTSISNVHSIARSSF